MVEPDSAEKLREPFDADDAAAVRDLLRRVTGDRREIARHLIARGCDTDLLLAAARFQVAS
jgi:hypothetical protein